VKAVVVLKFFDGVTDQELREFCRGYIAGYKIPKVIQCVGELPKIDEVMDREQINALFGQQGRS
jgi:acyl-CoA synthetase (AMP-forming)/AMP-acid ligase II